MKKMLEFIAVLSLAAVVLPGCSMFYMEESDTIVEWGFADDTESEITNGVETLLPSAQDLFGAFKTEFEKEGDLLEDNSVILRAQKGEKKAVNTAQSIAERAHMTLPADFSCPADYIFVVRVQYNPDNAPVTVWSHDYRSSNSL